VGASTRSAQAHPLARLAQVPLEHFSLGSALLKRHRRNGVLRAHPAQRAHGREVSPQRLVHSRENWYLDTWCHLRNDLRSFSIDGIRRIEVLDTASKEIPLKTLDAYLLESYGIVRGGEAQRARLRFSVERARWVASEVWHPDQKGSFDAESLYSPVAVPATIARLMLDILRYSADDTVEVLFRQ
jgi:predicted DNA-binding transcriptional regulator YafY